MSADVRNWLERNPKAIYVGSYDDNEPYFIAYGTIREPYIGVSFREGPHEKSIWHLCKIETEWKPVELRSPVDTNGITGASYEAEMTRPKRRQKQQA